MIQPTNRKSFPHFFSVVSLNIPTTDTLKLNLLSYMTIYIYKLRL